MNWFHREKQIHRVRCITVHLHINISVLRRNFDILLSSAFGLALSPIIFGLYFFDK